MTRSELCARLVKRYRGLPLSIDDLTDLTGVPRKYAHHLIGELVDAGRVERFTGPDGETLYRDPIAYRELAS